MRLALRQRRFTAGSMGIGQRDDLEVGLPTAAEALGGSVVALDAVLLRQRAGAVPLVDRLLEGGGDDGVGLGGEVALDLHALAVLGEADELRALGYPDEATADRRQLTMQLLTKLRSASFMLSDNLTERFFAHADQESSTVLAV